MNPCQSLKIIKSINSPGMTLYQNLDIMLGLNSKGKPLLFTHRARSVRSLEKGMVFMQFPGKGVCFLLKVKYISNSQNAGNCTDSSPKFKNFLGKSKTIISIYFIYSEPTEGHTLFEVDNMNGSLNEHW